MTGFEVVICGGGIAGVEGLLRLRRLAGDRVQVTLVSPEGEFVYRPLAVRGPFGLEGARRYPLGRIVSDAGATWVRDRAARIDGDARTVQTEGGREVSYDALLLALGGAGVLTLCARAAVHRPRRRSELPWDRAGDRARPGEECCVRAPERPGVAGAAL
jgi:NADH dehydrogenase FAD-containing subunit